LYASKDVHTKSLLKLIARRNISIITTSHDFVRTKYGTEIISATKCNATPIVVLM
jgi:hypothetical protein